MPAKKNAPVPAELQSDSSGAFTATLQTGNVKFLIAEGTTVLKAAELAGLQAASSCRNGTCRTCICQLVSGKVFYKIDWPGLSLDEKRTGCILPCVAYALSDLVLELPF